MDRPSKELVDRALNDTGLSAADPDEFTTYDVLAAEVRALREELADIRGAYDVLLRGEAYQAACSLLNASITRELDLRDTMTRVEELPAKWRRRTHTPKNQTMPRIYEAHGREQQDTACADELEAALKPCASSEPDTAPISAPDGQAEEPVVLENPAKQRETLP